MPDDWVRYALSKAYLHLVDTGVDPSVESMAHRVEQITTGGPLEDTITTGMIARYLAEEEGLDGR